MRFLRVRWRWLRLPLPRSVVDPAGFGRAAHVARDVWSSGVARQVVTVQAVCKTQVLRALAWSSLAVVSLAQLARSIWLAVVSLARLARWSVCLCPGCQCQIVIRFPRPNPSTYLWPMYRQIRCIIVRNLMVLG